LATRPVDTDNDGVELGVLADLVGYHLRRASNVFGGDFARALTGTGMRQVLFGILSVVDANPGINQGAAGRVLGIQRANMVALINELVDDGWIDRKVAAEDRRAFALTMTPAGAKKLAECLIRIRAHEDEMLADLSAADRGRLIALLSKVEAKER
jgi:DNA-binding MarR family transcriptional regulator